MRFERQNRSGCNFAPSVIIHGQIPSKFQICYHHRIEFANIKIVKICSQTKIRILNMNMGSEISYDVSERIFSIDVKKVKITKSIHFYVPATAEKDTWSLVSTAAGTNNSTILNIKTTQKHTKKINR